jgi:hypothetical protein
MQVLRCCANGHQVDEGARFCPTCGLGLPAPDVGDTTVVPVVASISSRTDVLPVVPPSLPLPSVLVRDAKGRRRRRRPPRLVAALGAAVVVVGGVVAGLALTSGGHGSAPPQGVAGMASLLNRSTNARVSVTLAIAGVESCQLDAQRGLTQLGNAVRVRHQVITDLPKVHAPTQLTAALTDALQLSVNADHHFQDWMIFVASNGCPAPHAPHNPDFTAANATSTQASAAKARFVGLWNPVAAANGLRQVHAGDF